MTVIAVKVANCVAGIGANETDWVGLLLGSDVGWAVGRRVGCPVGCVVGCDVG